MLQQLRDDLLPPLMDDELLGERERAAAGETTLGRNAQGSARRIGAELSVGLARKAQAAAGGKGGLAVPVRTGFIIVRGRLALVAGRAAAPNAGKGTLDADLGASSVRHLLHAAEAHGVQRLRFHGNRFSRSGDRRETGRNQNGERTDRKALHTFVLSKLLSDGAQFRPRRAPRSAKKLGKNFK